VAVLVAVVVLPADGGPPAVPGARAEMFPEVFSAKHHGFPEVRVEA
jgi:hypothetical protein